MRGIGFAAGERIRVTLLDGTLLGRGAAGPLGVARIHYRVPRSPGRHTVVVHGVASRLAARHPIAVRRASGSGIAVATARFTALTSPQPTHVAILIKGKGARCVAWHKGITGDAILNKVARVVYRQSDGLIVQIDGTPASATADDTHYWSYWHDVNGTWQYSSAGASGYQPAPGTVDGWAYDNGAQQPPKPNNSPGGLYAAICGSADQSTAPTSTAPAPSPRHSSASPRRHHAVAPPPTRAAERHAPSTSTSAHRTPIANPSTRVVRAAPQSHARSRSRAAQVRKPRASVHTRTASRDRAAIAARTSPAPPASPSASRPRLLVKPAAQPTRGSALPTLLALGLVVLLLAGGGILALRRRRAG